MCVVACASPLIVLILLNLYNTQPSSVPLAIDFKSKKVKDVNENRDCSSAWIEMDVFGGLFAINKQLNIWH